MINVFKKMSMKEAKNWAQSIDEKNDAAFKDLVASWEKKEVDPFDQSYGEMRNLLIDTYYLTLNEFADVSKNRQGYMIDLRLGFVIYHYLNSEKNFNIVVANDDDVWRYISCKVIPDITHLRYPPSKKDAENNCRINPKRFFAHTRRIWIKTLWWYIHLSWQGNEADTFEVLKDFGTDTISDFIERPGRGKGYRVPLFRAMVKGYSTVNNKKSDLFNNISKLNLVKCKTLEPALTENGEAGYVSSLLDEIVAR